MSAVAIILNLLKFGEIQKKLKEFSDDWYTVWSRLIGCDSSRLSSMERQLENSRYFL